MPKLIRRLLGGVFSLSVLLFGMQSLVTAQVPAFGGISTCGSGEITYSTSVSSMSSGQLYLKTNAAGLKTDGAIYIEDGETGKCTALGKAQINDKSWTRIAEVGPQYQDKAANVIIASTYIGADAYASVATVLIVPDDSCKLTKSGCVGSYQGSKGVIEPQNISSPGDFLTVQTIPDISQEKIKYVEYYDGGNFLYATKEIEAIDRRYLRGGDRTVKKVVYLTNDRLLTITENIPMPKDPLYSQYLKSTFFRLGSQTKTVVVLVGAITLVFFTIKGVRRFHAWRTYRNGHGIETYLRTHHQ